MRQISFSRSLMDLARDVELKCGSISPETDRLLHVRWVVWSHSLCGLYFIVSSFRILYV